jgi:hypothetical protein
VRRAVEQEAVGVVDEAERVVAGTPVEQVGHWCHGAVDGVHALEDDHHPPAAYAAQYPFEVGRVVVPVREQPSAVRQRLDRLPQAPVRLPVEDENHVAMIDLDAGVPLHVVREGMDEADVGQHAAGEADRPVASTDPGELALHRQVCPADPLAHPGAAGDQPELVGARGEHPLDVGALLHVQEVDAREVHQRPALLRDDRTRRALQHRRVGQPELRGDADELVERPTRTGHAVTSLRSAPS